MKLYYHPVSTYSQKVLIALAEKQVGFEPCMVNFGDPAARADYERRYPRGKIPVLVTPAGDAIAESTIIIEYLENHHPGGQALIPGQDDDAREVRYWDRVADLYLNDPTATLLFQKVGFRQFSEDQLARADKHLRLTYAQLDQRLAGRAWLCGEFSLADCAAIPPLYYAQSVMALDDYPNLAAYAARANARPSYARLREEFIPLWQRMSGRG